jgi:hypothetical protein
MGMFRSRQLTTSSPKGTQVHPIKNIKNIALKMLSKQERKTKNIALKMLIKSKKKQLVIVDVK